MLEASISDFHLATRGAVSMVRLLLFRSFRAVCLHVSLSFPWSVHLTAILVGGRSFPIGNFYQIKYRYTTWLLYNFFLIKWNISEEDDQAMTNGFEMPYFEGDSTIKKLIPCTSWSITSLTSFWYCSILEKNLIHVDDFFINVLFYNFIRKCKYRFKTTSVKNPNACRMVKYPCHFQNALVWFLVLLHIVFNDILMVFTKICSKFLEVKMLINKLTN